MQPLLPDPPRSAFGLGAGLADLGGDAAAAGALAAVGFSAHSRILAASLVPEAKPPVERRRVARRPRVRRALLTQVPRSSRSLATSDSERSISYWTPSRAKVTVSSALPPSTSSISSVMTFCARRFSIVSAFLSLEALFALVHIVSGHDTSFVRIPTRTARISCGSTDPEQMVLLLWLGSTLRYESECRDSRGRNGSQRSRPH